MYQNAILSVFVDITKIADLCWKNSYISRTEGMNHLIYMFSGSTLVKI